MGTNYSRRRVLGLYLRGDKLGKIDFWQILEGVGSLKNRNNRWVVVEFNVLGGQRRMTSTVDTGIAAIGNLMLIKGGTRTLVGCGNVLIICRHHIILHCMNTFVHTINRDGQHDNEDKSGNEF